MLNLVKKNDGSISIGRLIGLAIIVSIVFSIIGSTIGSLFEDKKKIEVE